MTFILMAAAAKILLQFCSLLSQWIDGQKSSLTNPGQAGSVEPPCFPYPQATKRGKAYVKSWGQDVAKCPFLVLGAHWPW